MGPLVNEAAVENYLSYQGIAVREGPCEEVMRGKPLERTPKGHYVSPSIHLVAKPDPKSVYQKSEIFGPNVCPLSRWRFGRSGRSPKPNPTRLGGFGILWQP